MSRFLLAAVFLFFCFCAAAEADFINNVKLSGFVIGRYQCAETTPLGKGLLDVQNAKLKLAGELAPNLRFTLLHDFATNGGQGLLNVASLARTRNRCNSEGYESVALIPLRSGNEIIGLL
jgi:hypothetical protein